MKPAHPPGARLQLHVLVLHTAPASVPHHRPRFVPSCQFSSKLQRYPQLTQFCQNDPLLLTLLSQAGGAGGSSKAAPGAAVPWLEPQPALSPAPQGLQAPGQPHSTSASLAHRRNCPTFLLLSPSLKGRVSLHTWHATV